MKIKHLLLIITLLLFSQFSFGQNHIIKGRGLYLPGQPILYFNTGIGYEYMIDKNMSLQLVYNYSGNDMRETDGNANFKSETILDYRFYNTEVKPISKTIFAFCFLSYSFEKNKFGGEIDFTNNPIIIKQTTIEKAFGAGIGKNFKYSKRFHIEFFVGPKIISREISTDSGEILSSFISNSKSTSLKFGIRGGLNLAFQFGQISQ